MYMCTVEYYTAGKKNKLLLPVIIWMNLTDTTVSKRSQAQRVVTETSIYRKKKTGKSVQADGCQNNGYVRGKIMLGWGHRWELWGCWSYSTFRYGCGYLDERTL